VYYLPQKTEGADEGNGYYDEIHKAFACGFKSKNI